MIRSLLPTLIIVLLTVFLACEKNAVSLDTVTMQIADRYKDCVGISPRKCLQVKINDEPAYGLFYNPIEGFIYEEGYEYNLLVKQEKVDNPPADGSSIRYVLVKLIGKVKK